MAQSRQSSLLLLSFLFLLVNVLTLAETEVVCPLLVHTQECSLFQESSSVYQNEQSQGGPKRITPPNPKLYQGDIILSERQHHLLQLKSKQARDSDNEDFRNSTGQHVTAGNKRNRHHNPKKYFSRQKRASIGRNGDGWSELWPNGIVPFLFSPQHGGFSEREKLLVRSSMAFISSQSCVKFVEHPFSNKPHIVHLMPNGTDCDSRVGFERSTRQVMHLPDGCITLEQSIATHELLHLIGFWHENNRKDRDNYVLFRPQYVQMGFEWIFEKDDQAEVFNTEYDIESILHYEGWEYTKPGDPHNLVSRVPGKKLGQLWAPTLMDMFEVNMLYNCQSKLGLGNAVACFTCIRLIRIVATTSMAQQRGGSPVQLDWIVRSGRQFVKKRFLLTTSNRAGKSFLPGGTDFWEFPVSGCIRPRNIEMMALRAAAKWPWRPERVHIFLKLSSQEMLLASNTFISKDIKLGTNQQTQRLLPAVRQPNCHVCQSTCIRQLNIFMDHYRSFSRGIAKTTHAVVLSWKRGQNISDFARLDLPAQLHTAQSRTFQASSVPLDTSQPSTCLTANSLHYLYLVPVDSTGTFQFSGPSTRLDSAIVTAEAVDGSEFVLAELSTPIVARGNSNVRALKVKKCAPCGRC